MKPTRPRMERAVRWRRVKEFQVRVALRLKERAIWSHLSRIVLGRGWEVVLGASSDLLLHIGELVRRAFSLMGRMWLSPSSNWSANARAVEDQSFRAIARQLRWAYHRGERHAWSYGGGDREMVEWNGKVLGEVGAYEMGYIGRWSDVVIVMRRSPTLRQRRIGRWTCQEPPEFVFAQSC